MADWFPPELDPDALILTSEKGFTNVETYVDTACISHLFAKACLYILHTYAHLLELIENRYIDSRCFNRLRVWGFYLELSSSIIAQKYLFFFVRILSAVAISLSTRSISSQNASKTPPFIDLLIKSHQEEAVLSSKDFYVAITPRNARFIHHQPSSSAITRSTPCQTPNRDKGSVASTRLRRTAATSSSGRKACWHICGHWNQRNTF